VLIVISILDYPAYEEFSGPLHSIQHNELQPSHIESLPIQAYYEKLEQKPKTSLFGSLFKREHRDEYPKSQPYSGEYQHTYRNFEHPHSDIGQHAMPYHSGVYDKIEERPTVIETIPTLKGINLKLLFYLITLYFRLSSISRALYRPVTFHST
jgi:hypothetical protein